MNVVTSISGAIPGDRVIRGRKLSELVREATFSEALFLLLSGRSPEPADIRLVDAILVSCMDHGPAAPSAMAARTAASCGVPLQSAVAAGILCIGDHHGGAGEACARLLQTAIAEPGQERSQSPDTVGLAAAHLVATILDSGARLPGFGHRIYRDEDPRATELRSIARKAGRAGPHLALAEATAAAWRERTGRSLPLNVDGAQAAILSDLGFPWWTVRSFFIVGRSAGLCAQALEEARTGGPLGFVKAAGISEAYAPAGTDLATEGSPRGDMQIQEVTG